jgi:hypothetical protein
MRIISIIAQVIFLVSIIIFGIISWRKPDLIGSEFYWSKYKWFYIPNYRKTTNQQYQHQIRIIGIGLLLSLPFIVIVCILQMF